GWELTGFEGHEGREELYSILEGEGLMKVGPYQRPVARGDLTLIPAGERHQLINTSQGLLRMLCLGGKPEGETPPERFKQHRSALFVRNAATTVVTPGAEGCELRILFKEEERMFESSLIFFTDYVIQPGRANVGHSHQDREEANFILEGEGIIRTEADERRIREGDGIYIPRGERHQFLNDSKTPLHFVHFAARASSTQEMWE
ncbi:MAG: cupin domain-containing protein, partial [Candidatus Bathyarchaeia archaeon]